MAARVLGFDTYVGNVEMATASVIERARSRDGGYAVLGNVHVLVTAQHDARLGDALRKAWTVFPDGAPVAWLQRRTGRPDAARVAGAELMLAVVRAGEATGLRHALLGSTPDVLAGLESCLRDVAPGIEIVAAVSPPFAPVADLADAADSVAASSPDVVWVALGAPKQELFMLQHGHRLNGALALGVGAAFDFLAGSKSRAPQWMQRTGLEWLHRLASEPRRLAGRYFRTNGEFLIRAALDLRRPS